MKRFFTLVFIWCIFAQVAYSQQSATKPLSSVIALNYGANGVTLTYCDSTKYNYDAFGREYESYNYNHNGSGVWKPFSRSIDYTYDTSGNLVSLLVQHYFNSQAWEDNLFITYSWDIAGNQLSRVVYAIDSAGWVINNGQYYTYDDAGRVLTRTTSGGYRIRNQYSEEGLLLAVFDEKELDGNWVVSSRELYTYDLQNLVWLRPLYSIVEYPSGGLTWSPVLKRNYTHDGAGDLAEERIQYYNNNAWGDAHRSILKYDEKHNRIYLRVEDWEENKWVSTVQIYYDYDSDSDMVKVRSENKYGCCWYPSSLKKYNYLNPVSTHGPQPVDFDVFPNPASSVLTVQGEDLFKGYLFNQEGRTIQIIDLQGVTEKTLPLEGLPGGTYFLNVLDTKGNSGTRVLRLER